MIIFVAWMQFVQGGLDLAFITEGRLVVQRRVAERTQARITSSSNTQDVFRTCLFDARPSTSVRIDKIDCDCSDLQVEQARNHCVSGFVKGSTVQGRLSHSGNFD
jgi:hypothetical protein